MTPRSSLVTGATGFVGSNLVVELLRRDRATVYCLVRPGGDARARLVAAVAASADAAGLGPAVADRLDRLVAVTGDLGRPGLGISPADREVLAAAAPDECWHAAASLRYEDRHRDDILATNVDGTRHALDVAAALGIARFHHVSTAYVAGRRTGEVPEEPFDRDIEANNWYEHSKRRGEDAVVERAADFDRVRILRPSIVVGNRTTARSTSTTGYYGFLDGLAAFSRLVEADRPGYLDDHPIRLLLEPASSLDLVPIDLLVAEAVTIADDPSDDARYAHLTNPYPIRLDRARIGPERSIERLRLELVEERHLLDAADLVLDDALDFYRPYLRNDKRFLRTRDAGAPSPAMFLSDERLVALSLSHFDGLARPDRATVSGP